MHACLDVHHIIEIEHNNPVVKMDKRGKIMDKILWNSRKTPYRFFWIPRGESVDMGDFGIENAEGEQFDVDLADIAPFEITQDHADLVLRRGLDDLLSNVGGVLRTAWDAGKQEFDQKQREAQPQKTTTQTNTTEKPADILDLEDLISTLEKDMTDPLSSVHKTIQKEMKGLSAEIRSLGADLLRELNSLENRKSLRELGEYFIRLADGETIEDIDEEDSDSELVESTVDNEDSDDTVVIRFDPIMEQSPIAEDTVAEDMPSTSVEPDLQQMTKAQLLEVANQLGLKIATKSTKQQIIESIESNR